MPTSSQSLLAHLAQLPDPRGLQGQCCPFAAVLRLNAGLLQHSVTRLVPRRGGAYLGVVKHNHRKIKDAIDNWLVAQGIAVALTDGRAADSTTIEKNRRRMEERPVWIFEAGELSYYLVQKYGWWHVQQAGWLRRQQRRHTCPGRCKRLPL